VQTAHVQCAREMATVAAKNMALAAAAAQFAPLPCIQLKFLQFSWTFYGVAEGNEQTESIYITKQTQQCLLVLL
jgi:hypothetical protein